MNNELVIDNLPRSIDVVKGDVLVTSGLGGRFPEGYPVAIVKRLKMIPKVNLPELLLVR